MPNTIPTHLYKGIVRIGNGHVVSQRYCHGLPQHCSLMWQPLAALAALVERAHFWLVAIAQMCACSYYLLPFAHASSTARHTQRRASRWLRKWTASMHWQCRTMSQASANRQWCWRVDERRGGERSASWVIARSWVWWSRTSVLHHPKYPCAPNDATTTEWRDSWCPTCPVQNLYMSQKNHLFFFHTRIQYQWNQLQIHDHTGQHFHPPKAIKIGPCMTRLFISANNI